MAPPLPDASQPSNSTHTGGPNRPSPISPAHTNRSRSSRLEAACSRRFSSFLESDSERSSSSRRDTRPSAAVAVGDRHPAVLAERLGRHSNAYRRLAPLPLGDVDQPDDPADDGRVESR